MQRIIVEVVGKRKTVTVDQLRELLRRNYVSTNTELLIDGKVCRVGDVYAQLLDGASILTLTESTPQPSKKSAPISFGKISDPKGAESPLFDIDPNKGEDFFPVPEDAVKDANSSSKSTVNKIGYKIAIAGVAILVLIGSIVALLSKNASQNHINESQLARATSEGINDQEKTQRGQTETNEQVDYSDERLFDFDEYANEQKTNKNDFSDVENESPETEEISNSEQIQETDDSDENIIGRDHDDFYVDENNDEHKKEDASGSSSESTEIGSDFDFIWKTEDEEQDKLEKNAAKPAYDPSSKNDRFTQQTAQSVKESTAATPLLVVDHDKIFADFFSNEAKKNKIPTTITVSSSKQLEQTLAKLDDKPHTIILKQSPEPYELRDTSTIASSITIKGESDNPSDTTILVVPDSTKRLGALEVSGGKLTLEGVTIKRNASCSEEYALVSVDSKGEANITNCVFDASSGWGGRGVSAVGIGSSAILENVSFIGFADGVYAFSSSRMRASNKCVFEANERGATVGDGAELIVSDSSFTRNKTGVQVKTDGTGSLTNSSFENNDVPCVVDSYSERKFKRSNNKGLE